jgi:hypothetical protein
MQQSHRYVVAREKNVLVVDFKRKPDPPAPKFPGAGALHEPDHLNGQVDMLAAA